MKLSLTYQGEISIIEVNDDNFSSPVMLEYMYRLMLSAGFQKNYIDEAVIELADSLKNFE